MEGHEEEARMARKKFIAFFLLAEMIGLVMIGALITWIVQYFGGLGGRSEPNKLFNWHPLLMTIGMIFLYSNTILIYRIFPSARKIVLKIVHTVLHLVVFILVVLGLVFVFEFHDYVPKKIPHMFSLHSWMGIMVVIIFTIQYVVNILVYLIPNVKYSVRAVLMPWHINFGIILFVVAIATALTGFSEKALYGIKRYTSLPMEGIFMNILGLIYIIFGAIMVYLITETSYKRRPQTAGNE